MHTHNYCINRTLQRVLIGFILLLPLFSIAQRGDTLELSDAILLAQKQSPDARIAALGLKAATFDYQSFQADFLPQVSLSLNLPGLNRRIQNQQLDDGSQQFITSFTSFSNLNLNVLQRIPQTGGTVIVTSNLFNIQNFEPIESERWQASPFGLTLSQPLFQLNTFKWDKQAQSIAFRSEQIDFLSSLEEAASNATRIYFDALQAQLERSLAQLNVINNDTIYNISKGRFSVGKIAENELLQSELSLIRAQAALETANLSYERATRQLRTYLSMSLDEEIVLKIPTNYPQVEVNPDYAVEQALKYNEIIIQAEQQKLLADRQVIDARRSTGFNVNLNASFGFNQSAEALGDAYRDLQERQSISFQIDVPILQWGKRKAEVGAALARQKLTNESLKFQQQNLRDDIYFQVLNLKQRRTQLIISARSDTIAQKRYDIAKNRYLIGKIPIQDLFLAQQDKDQAQQTFVSNLRSFYEALQSLRSETLFDFISLQPLRVEEQMLEDF